MGLFGPTIIKEFEERESEYYFQVLLTRPKDNKIQVNPTRMWETEKEALNDLPYIIPKLVERDPKEKDSLIIRDASVLTKYIYIAKVEKPSRMDIGYSKIDDIEQDSLQRYLTKNNIMFKVKLQNNLISANRNKVVNVAIIDMKDSLKNTEFTKKCVKYIFKDDGYSYDRFISGLDDSLSIAYYDAHLGIPNPRRNVPMLDKFYSELHDAVNAANTDILRMGFKIELSGDWDRGIVVMNSLSSSIGESNIIYEEPSTLKIDGKPADEEGEEDDNNNYAIQNEPEEETQAEEEPPANEDPAPEGEEGGEEPPAEEDPEDAAPTDYRIPDNDGEEEPADGEDNPPNEGEEPAPEGEEGGEEPTEGEDDAPTDYRVNTDDAEEGGEGEETPEDDNAGGEPTEGENPEDGQNDEAKTQEDEIFSNMSPEQRRIQDEELKENYIKLYNTIGDLISRINQISVDNTSREPISFIQSQLSDMKEYVFKYLSEVYSTKTYIENNINYQQYLVILSNINNLLMQLNAKSTDID